MRSLLAAISAAALLNSVQTIHSQTNQITPPPLEREFRAAWIATVSNIDWPSKKGLSTDEQKKELIAILDKSVELRLNAVVLQVRPACDAFYESKYEPWSEYLTGEMGKPPQPYYDPLTFAITEAHKRGLELHAWFNPYRAKVLGSKSAVATNHISKTHPELVRKYVKYLWLDPGEPQVQQHSINVIMDVVKRYDVDGIHFDDYFYPYRDNDTHGKPLDFPDERSWDRYKKSGGKLNRGDWRRENVNTFVERLYSEIKKEKSWVKFGISPFGIWKPGVPKGTKGYDAHGILYADSVRWLTNGWVDYFAPQLYWNINAPEQSYPVLLKWWVEQNTKQRLICPGISTARVGNTRDASEIANQIRLTRQQPGACGNIHWNFKSLLKDQKGVATLLEDEIYTEPALMPAQPWLKSSTPQRPFFRVEKHDKFMKLFWDSPERVWQWVLQVKVGGTWKTEVINASETKREIWHKEPGSRPEVVALTSLDRYGNASPVAVVTIE